MSSPVDALQTMLADFASDVTNRALGSDPDISAHLQKLAGRTLEVNVEFPPHTWHLIFEADEVRVRPGPADAPNVIISGSVPALANWLTTQQGKDVRVDGDVAVLMQLAAFVEKVKPDPSAVLTAVFGAQRAAQLAAMTDSGLKGIKSAVEGVSKSVRQNAGEQFVNEPALHELLSGIDELRLRVDRLAANVRQRERHEKD